MLFLLLHLHKPEEMLPLPTGQNLRAHHKLGQIGPLLLLPLPSMPPLKPTHPLRHLANIELLFLQLPLIAPQNLLLIVIDLVLGFLVVPKAFLEGLEEFGEFRAEVVGEAE